MKSAQTISGQIHHWYNAYHLHLAEIGTRMGFGQEETKDVIHQFFLELMEKRIDQQSVDNPKAYLSVAFRRKLIDIHRSSSRKKIVELTELQDTQVAPSIQETLEKIQASTELVARIRKAYHNLPQRCQKVIYLKYFEGLTTEQIAERTCVNKRTVYNSLFEGVKLLRAELHSVSSSNSFEISEVLGLLVVCIAERLL